MKKNHVAADDGHGLNGLGASSLNSQSLRRRGKEFEVRQFNRFVSSCVHCFVQHYSPKVNPKLVNMDVRDFPSCAPHDKLFILL